MRDVFQDVEIERDESACYYRFSLNVATGEVGGHKHADALAGDFPMWDQRLTGLRNQYSWLATFVENGTPYNFNALQKVNNESGEASVYDFGAGRFTSEALFIPRASDAAEDDGWLAAVVFNANTGKSEISLVDARAMDREVAVIPLRHHIPFGFHGFYAPQVFTPGQ
jgi:all-trans-8'-apo-beta-carotenal 15,15'-oxygenase